MVPFVGAGQHGTDTFRDGVYVAEPIPVIDLFAGPGGLGEGFCTATQRRGRNPAFKITISIEKDPIAHATLELRAFFRHFARDKVPDDYYEHLRAPETLTREFLFKKHARATKAARSEAWCAELGEEPESEIDSRIRSALAGY